MSDNSSNGGHSSAAGGIGFFGLLAIVFIVLKLYNVISWSWWWVLAPLWGPAALAMTILVIVLVVALTGQVRKELKRRERKR